MGEGKVLADGLIVLPNGNRINPRETPGAHLKERIDNWQKTQTAPQVSTNFVGAAEITTNYSWSKRIPEVEESAERATKDQEELQVLENLVTTTQRKIDRARKKLGPSNQEEEGLTTRSKAQAAQQRKENPAVTVEKVSRPDP